MGLLQRLLGKEAEDSSPPALPEGQRIYAIGDIHGRADLLDEVTRVIAAHAARDPASEIMTIFLGDYVDRGPDSKGVLDRLSTGAFPTPVIALLGNHELMMLEFLADPDAGARWGANGGLETLHSYGLDVRQFRTGRGLSEMARAFRETLPEAHLTFLRSLRTSFSSGDYFFCHAGVRPGVPLEKQVQHDLLWIREEFLSFEKSHGKVIVHGHTPCMKPDVRANRINLDTGAYVSGLLTCLVLEGTSQRFFAIGRKV